MMIRSRSILVKTKRAGRALWLALAAIGFCLPSGGQAGPRSGDEAAEAAMLEALRAQDLRVATVAYRLVTAGLPLCGGRGPQAGLVLHDAAQYGAGLRAAAVRHFGFGDGPSLSVVVPDGPAARAGLLADDALIAINGVKLGLDAASRRAIYDGVAQATAALGAAIEKGSAVLTVRRAGRIFDVVLEPAIACRSEVQLIPSSRMNAEADGRYVQVTTAIVDYVASDDELAVVIGHELAHNILGHRARLDAAGVGTGLFARFGKQAARIRETEIEADRLGLQLMAHAGYEIAAAPTFWRRFGKEHGPGLFADATHPGWRKREAILADAISEIQGRGMQEQKKGPIREDQP